LNKNEDFEEVEDFKESLPQPHPKEGLYKLKCGNVSIK